MQVSVANQPVPTKIPAVAVINPATGNALGAEGLPVALSGVSKASPLPTDTLASAGAAKSIAAGAASVAVTLTPTTTRVSLKSVGGAMRYAISTGAPVATATNSGGDSHYIGADERLDLSVAAGSTIAAIQDASDTNATSLEITELV